MMHVAIVDDELLYVNQLKEYIARYERESGNKIKVSMFNDGDGIVHQYSSDYDLILMDVKMGLMDGMTAAEKIRQMDKEVIIIFITNMIQYAVHGYQVDAMDYLVKPVEYFAFSQRLDRAMERMKKKISYYIYIPVEDGITKLDINDIFYLESQNHYMVYKTNNGEYISRGTMRELEKKLSPYGFFRSNKGYLVNMKHVEHIRDGCCVILDKLLPISRAKKKPFMDALLNYMSEVVR